MGFFAFVNFTAQGRNALRRRFRHLDEIEARIGLTDKAGAQAFERRDDDQARQVAEWA